MINHFRYHNKNKTFPSATDCPISKVDSEAMLKSIRYLDREPDVNL